MLKIKAMSQREASEVDIQVKFQVKSKAMEATLYSDIINVGSLRSVQKTKPAPDDW